MYFYYVYKKNFKVISLLKVLKIYSYGYPKFPLISVCMYTFNINFYNKDKKSLNEEGKQVNLSSRTLK